MTRDDYVLEHLPLARRLARIYAGPGERQDDLAQVAAIGLIKAADNYDPARGVPFRSYATPMMIGEMKRHLRNNSWAVKIPRPVKELALRIGRALEQRDMSVDELAAALDTDRHKVAEALNARRASAVRSLDAHRFGDDGSTYADRVGEDDPALDFDYAPALAGVLRALPTLERTILHLSFVEDLPQTAIAKHVGCSQMQVSRLMRRALAKLEAVV